jgi:alpha-tubulin suppressor-like RCC1 family protein
MKPELLKPLFATTVFAVCGLASSLLAQPILTQQPTNQVVALGGTMALSVTTSDTLAAYQWLKDGSLILGATNSTLIVANAGLTNSGSYYVVATNATGMAISLPVLVEIGASSLLAWGNNAAGNLGDGTSGTIANKATPEFIAVNSVTAAGGSASLFVKIDGSLWVMGVNNSGQMGTGSTSLYGSPTPTNVANNVTAVAAGSSHSLFVKSDGTLWAMGLNSSGQLGDSTTANRSSPVAVIGGTNVIAVAAGFAHSLFLKSDGTLWAMGFNSSGQLGDGTAANQTSPVAIIGGTNVVAVAAGQLYSLFLKSDGTLWVMGRNNYGQLGNGTTSATNQPIVVGSNVVAIAAGAGHSLFVTTDGQLWGMGLNSSGQLGDSTTANRSTPVPVIGGTSVVAVAAGASHTVFLKSDGTLWAMGGNSSGQLGDGTTANRSTPVPVAVTNILFAGIHSGNAANYSFGIGQSTLLPFSSTTQAAMPVNPTNATLNGMVLPNGKPTTAWFKWGPLGSFTQTTSPVDIGSGLTVVRVSAPINGLNSGNVYQCSLVASNSTGVVTGAVQWFRVDQAPKVAAWGNNGSGQMQIPQNLTNVMALAGGGVHSLALLANGTVRAWGANSLGQCNVPATATNVVALGTGKGLSIPINLALRGDGTVVSWGNGVTVPPLNNVVAVAAGDIHGLALQADGTVVSWLAGYPPYYNNYGQANVPAGLTNVVAIGGGAGHSLALKADGTVIAWGASSDGLTNVPPNATNVVAIAAGSFHNLALRADGTVVAWGYNGNGQLNLPPGLSNVVAIVAGGFDSLVLKSDGTVVDAGEFYYGQSFLPVGLSNVVDIACGGFAQYALGGNVPPTVNSQTNSAYLNQDVVVSPIVFDANNDVFNSRVATLPAQGALYQYAGGARGPQITVPDTLITDAANRVIFAPALNNDGAPYAAFNLLANDGQADSALGTMTVNIFRAAQNFTAQNLGGGLQVQLASTANYPYILQMATNLTPPVVWQSILTNPADGNGNWSVTITNLPAYPAGYYRAAAQ